MGETEGGRKEGVRGLQDYVLVKGSQGKLRLQDIQSVLRGGVYVWHPGKRVVGGGLNGELAPRIAKSKFFLFHPQMVRNTNSQLPM